MNKAQLVAALTDRLGDRGAAALAVEELLDVIVRAVQAGDSVTITGFGVFERRERAARAGRNPQTGQAMQLAATSVPAFRAGATFRDVVSGARTLPAVGQRTVPAAAAAAPAAARRRPAPARTDAAFASAGRAAAPSTQAAESNGESNGEPNGQTKVSDTAGKSGKAGKPGKSGKKSNDKPGKAEKRDKDGGKKKRAKK